MPRSEAMIYWYLHDEGSKILLAVHDTEIQGFLIYNRVVEGVYAIRMFYIRPEVSGTKVGHRLISSLDKLKTLIFQTRKDITPDAMFAVTRGREVRLSETEKLITWAMNWEK